MTRVLLLTTLPDPSVERARHALRAADDIVVVRDAAALARREPGSVLIGFHTGQIVPPDLLRTAAAAYNFHGASPAYPGRDPHHFAVYEGATTYGATAHVMTERVDAGDILAVERFATPAQATPGMLLAMATEASFAILDRLGPRMARGEIIPPATGEAWSPVKRSRADFIAMCQIDPAIDAAEFERRVRAFDVEGYGNLYINLHGRKFRIAPHQDT